MSEDHHAHFWQPRVAIPFLTVALIWGSTWLVIKDQVGHVSPQWSATWRFLVAGVAMALLAKLRGETLWLDAHGRKMALLIGVPQFAMNFQFVYSSEQHLTSGIVAVLFALLLVPNALLGWAFLGQPLTRRFLAGSAIALAGIALLMLHEVRLAPATANAPLGVALAICGMLSASTSNVIQATPAARRVAMLPLLAWAMLIGTVLDALIASALVGPPQIDWHLRYLAGVGYLAIIGSVVTFPLYFALLRTLGPGRAAYNGVLVPVVAMTLSTVFEGYKWSLLAGAGAVLAMAGLVVALNARKPKPDEALATAAAEP